MPTRDAPHRILIGRVPYDRAPAARAPVVPEPLGDDAEGRPVYVEAGRANSRKLVFLPIGEAPLVGYVRADPPEGLSLADVVHAAFDEPLPRPDALCMLGVLAAKHVVLVDGTRLGGPREILTAAVAGVALEPAGFGAQAARVPDWALLEAARPRWDALAARLLAVRWLRELADPEFGFVRAIAPGALTLNRTTRDPVDVDQLLVVRSQDCSHDDLVVRVSEVGVRVVQAVQADLGREFCLAHGDSVEFLPVAKTAGAGASPPAKPAAAADSGADPALGGSADSPWP